MTIKIDNQVCFDHNSDACYESIASQEEIYLEEAEEEVHLFLSSYVPPRQPSNEGTSGRSRGAYSMVDASIDRRRSASVEEELEEASEELIDGDSDDPPLSDEKVSRDDQRG